MKENEIVANGLFARLNFKIETNDGEEEIYIEVIAGYELMQKLGLFFKEKYIEIFEGEYDYIYDAKLVSIEYIHKVNGLDINMSISTDEAATLKLKFDAKTLEDKNAKKIAMIREVLDFDKEAEQSVLRELFE
ncbi:hypothetical protein [Viridibacillus arvi]|uniref:hypothetical protein n=1 Tax=Viridibacillus arvi TaxID=263475 RepID=UPI0034CFA0E8